MYLSIAVCTYNRAGILGELLKNLCGQKAPKDSYRVIVVDNKSTDNTKEITDPYSGCLNIIYAYEPRQGLSYARNRALDFAETDYIAYLDDDVRLKSDWVSSALNAIDKYQPDICGGPIFPYYEDVKPKWFLDKYITFSWWGDVVHKVGNDEYLSGGNIIFKKALLEKLGGFNPELGMRANRLGYHEEAQIVKKAKDADPNLNILYIPELAVRHLVPRKKMSLIWQMIRSYHIARSDAILYEKEILENKAAFFILFINICYHLIAILLKSTIGAIFRNRKLYKYYQTYFMEKIMYNIDDLFKNLHITLFRIKICSKSVS